MPITVSCDFPSGKTILGETEEIEVSHCQTILCSEHEFQTDFPQSQINALMDASMTCSQELTYSCISAPWRVWHCLDIYVQLNEYFLQLSQNMADNGLFTFVFFPFLPEFTCFAPKIVFLCSEQFWAQNR